MDKDDNFKRDQRAKLEAAMERLDALGKRLDALPPTKIDWPALEAAELLLKDALQYPLDRRHVARVQAALSMLSGVLGAKPSPPEQPSPLATITHDQLTMAMQKSASYISSVHSSNSPHPYSEMVEGEFHLDTLLKELNKR